MYLRVPIESNDWLLREAHGSYCRICSDGVVTSTSPELIRAIEDAIAASHGEQDIETRVTNIHNFANTMWSRPVWSRGSIQYHIQMSDAHNGREPRSQRDTAAYTSMRSSLPPSPNSPVPIQTRAAPAAAAAASASASSSSSSLSTTTPAPSRRQSARQSTLPLSGLSVFAAAAANQQASIPGPVGIPQPCVHSRYDCTVCGPPSICIMHRRHALVCNQCQIVCKTHRVRSCPDCRLTVSCTHGRIAHECNECFLRESHILNQQQEDRALQRQRHAQAVFAQLTENDESERLARHLQSEEVFSQRLPMSTRSTAALPSAAAAAAASSSSSSSTAAAAVPAKSPRTSPSHSDEEIYTRSRSTSNRKRKHKAKESAGASSSGGSDGAAAAAAVAAAAAAASSSRSISKSASMREGLSAPHAAADLVAREAVKSALECVVCMSAQKDCMLEPCGHFGFCMACAYKCSECPICKKSIRTRKRVYMC